MMKERDFEILKLRLKGYSHEKIGRKLDVTSRTVQRRLKKFQQTYPRLRKLVFDIDQDKEVLAFLGLGEKPSENVYDQLIKRRWEQGYHIGNAPYAYRKDDNGDLIIVPEEAEVVKRIFELRDQRKSTAKIAGEVKLPEWKVQSILKNPIYKGWVCMRRRCHPGRHQGIISEELWDRVQTKVKRPFSPALPFGYYYDDNLDLRIDPEKAEKIKEAFRLRIQGKTYAEISRRLGWKPHTVRHRIKTPEYCGMKWKEGKLAKSDYPAIIDVEDWKTANGVVTKPGEIAAQKKKELEKNNRYKILACLGRDEKTVQQIAEETGLSPDGVRKHFKALKKDGIVMEIQPKPERKGSRLLPYRYRMRF